MYVKMLDCHSVADSSLKTERVHHYMMVGGVRRAREEEGTGGGWGGLGAAEVPSDWRLTLNE